MTSFSKTTAQIVKTTPTKCFCVLSPNFNKGYPETEKVNKNLTRIS